MKMVQRIALALVVVAVSGLAAAWAEDAKPVDRRGVIIKVEDSQITLRAKKPGAPEVIEIVVPVDDKTTVTLDDHDAKLSDLKPGLFCKITPVEGTATSIVATTPRRMREKQDEGK